MPDEACKKQTRPNVELAELTADSGTQRHHWIKNMSFG
jgi:hypothetical protein